MLIHYFCLVCDILLNSRYQESLGSNITETELDRESGEQRGLRLRRLQESIPFDKPAKKPLIKCGPSRSPH